MTIHIDTAEVAQMARARLKERFPHTKFSVRSSRYAGGSSIQVNWIDGPTVKAVQAAVGRLHGADFDGSIDLKTYNDTGYGNDFIFCDRDYSDATMEQMAQQIRERHGIPATVALYDHLDREVWEKTGHGTIGQAAAHELASMALC